MKGCVGVVIKIRKARREPLIYVFSVEGLSVGDEESRYPFHENRCGHGSLTADGDISVINDVQR